MSVTIDRTSQEAVFKIKNLDKLTSAGVEHASYTSGQGLVKATSSAILKKPKGGKVYVSRNRAGSRRRHRASAEGETHANFSGRARRSLDFTVSPGKLEFGYGVRKHNAPDYTEFLEFGTKNMGPRPSLQNGIKDQERNIENNIYREVGKRLGDKVIS